jgi:type IV secretory pathway VirB10-like protein
MSDKGNAASFDLSAGVPPIEGDIRPKPKFADRISKRVLMVAFLFVGALVAIFLVSLNNMDNKPAKKVAEKKAQSKSTTMQDFAVPTDVLGVAATDGTTGPKPSSLAKPEVPPPAPPSDPKALAGAGQTPLPGSPASGQVPPLGATGDIPPTQQIPTRAPQPTPEQVAEKQAVQERTTRMATARTAGLSARSFDAAATEQGGAPNLAEALKQAALMAGAQGAQAPAGQAPKSPDSEQDEKLDFVKNASKEERGYHPHVPLKAISANEVKTGTFIPMSLEQGINSDLPGEVTARVTEAVYDSVSGCRMLIPPMAKVVGRYDSKVALGQGRMLVVWNSLIFPNGDELNLAGMQGYNTQGQSGLDSEVDNHYLRLIGLSFGMSMITSGVQLSVPQPNVSSNGTSAAQTPSQIIAASLAQQYGQLGAQIIGKYLAVQPTLRNYPGERFMMMVPHTVVLPKVWRDRCTSATTR